MDRRGTGDRAERKKSSSVGSPWSVRGDKSGDKSRRLNQVLNRKVGEESGKAAAYVSAYSRPPPGGRPEIIRTKARAYPAISLSMRSWSWSETPPRHGTPVGRRGQVSGSSVPALSCRRLASRAVPAVLSNSERNHVYYPSG